MRTAIRRSPFNYTTSSIPNWSVAWPAPVHSNALNRLYYDPAITYRPPVDAANNPYPNQTTFATVRTDPWSPEVKTADLTASVNVGMWCNSDWPLDTDPNRRDRRRSHCRANGTDYNQAFHVDKVPGDYQYPWQKVSGADNVKYFWRSGAQKTLWCDRASPSIRSRARPPRYKCNTGNLHPAEIGAQPACSRAIAWAATPGSRPTSAARLHTDPGAGPPGLRARRVPSARPAPATTRRWSARTRSARRRSPASPTATRTAAATTRRSERPAHGRMRAVPPPGVGHLLRWFASRPRSRTARPNGRDLRQAAGRPGHEGQHRRDALPGFATNGEVCRHNNWSYPDGTIADPFNYSAAHAKYKSAVAGRLHRLRPGAGNGRTSEALLEDQRRVVRDPHRDQHQRQVARLRPGGSCQDDRDAAHPYPRFYKYGVAKTDPAYADN